jgi:hypothetical protein
MYVLHVKIVSVIDKLLQEEIKKKRNSTEICERFNKIYIWAQTMVICHLWAQTMVIYEYVLWKIMKTGYYFQQ